MTRPRSRLRKAARIAGYAGAVLVVLAVVVAVGAPIYYRGARFGRLVETAMPEMRGKLHVGGGRWTWSLVWALARARPATIAVEDVTVTDPEGTEVLYARRASARVTIHRGPTRILIDDLVLDGARWRFARMKTERKVGFLATFEGVRRRAPRAPARPGGFELSIAGAQLNGVDATFDLATWGLALRDVHGTGALALKSNAFTFAVSDATVRGGGELRILGANKGVVLPFERARLDRVATTADARDDIRLAASDIVTGRSRSSGSGVFTGVYGFTPASAKPGIDLEARIEDAADAIGAMLARRGLAAGTTVGGRGASLLLGFSGAFDDDIAIDAVARGFDVTSPRLEARDIGFNVTAEPLAGRFRLAKLELASPQGGRLAASATLDRLSVDAEVDFTRFSPRALLPAALRPFVTGTVDGELRARANLLVGAVELTRSTLVVSGAGGGGKRPRPLALLAGPGTRPPPGATVVRFSSAAFAAGAIHVPRVTLALAGGTVAAQGDIAIWDTEARRWLAAPRLALALDARGISVQRLLGVGFAHGKLSFHADLRGTPDDLALDVGFSRAGGGLTVLGEPVELPARASLRLGSSGLVIESLPLGGPGGSTLRCSGRIGVSGRLALDVGVRGFPIARLPGLAGVSLPLSGAISGAIRIAGDPHAPAVSGDVTFTDVAIRDQRLGGGTLTITPERGGAIRARGRVIDGIAVDGVLVPRAAGLEGAVTLTLSKLRLDPFLPRLPLAIGATGVASGTLAARIAPGQPATAEGTLSELSVTLHVPAGRRATAAVRPLSMHADGDIKLTARSDEGLTLGAARLRGDIGAFELTARSRGDDLDAKLRGRIELDALAPFARRWLDRLQGALDVDVTASRAGASGRIEAKGTATVAAPISAQPAGMPLAFGIPGGSLRLDGDAITTTALPVTVRAVRFPVAVVQSVAAEARVSARVDGLRARPKLRARTVIDRLEIVVPLAGPQPVRSAGGQVDVEADLAAGSFAVTRVDLPVEAEIERLNPTTGVNVGRAKLALRLRGTPRKLTLTGDIDVAAARVQADALSKAKTASGGKAGGTGRSGGAAGGMLPPQLDAMVLDLRLRSRGGAVDVDINNFPDLRVDLDMHVGGTAKRPMLTGTTKGAGLWSSFVLALRRIFS